MACNCDALKADLLSQRELMAEWFQILMAEIRDAKAELVELIKANTFNVGEQQITTDQRLTGQQYLSASAFLDSSGSPLQFMDAVSDSNPVCLPLEPTRNPEMEPTPGPVIRKELISPKIEPTGEEQLVEFSLTRNVSDKTLDEEAKTPSALNLFCSVESKNLSAVTVKTKKIETMSAKKPFACDQCEYRCATKGNLTRHKRSHTDEKLFRCHLCQKQFKQEHRLTVHMLVHNHNRANPFKCELCNFRCSKTIDLTRHIGLRHTGKKKLACDQCSFTAYQNAHLKIHQRVHTGEKPFACNQCDFCASQKSKLGTHQRIHTGEKPFACDQCDFRARQKGNLEIHQRIHTGEKPFACDQCDYRASQKGDLKIHHRIHSGEKPFQCDFCDYRAVSRSTMMKHRKRKHKTKR